MKLEPAVRSNERGSMRYAALLALALCACTSELDEAPDLRAPGVAYVARGAAGSGEWRAAPKDPSYVPQVGVLSEALTQTLSATVTVEPGNENFGPWDVETVIAAFCRWQGGFNQGSCTNFHTTDPRCTCGNGTHAAVGVFGSNPPSQFVAGKITGNTIVQPQLLVNKPMVWDDFILSSSSNVFPTTVPPPNPSFKQGSLKTKRVGTTDRWVVTLVIIN